MDNARSSVVIDVILALVIIVFSIVIYFNTLDLPPPRYEPMGAAALPRALAVLLIIFSLFILIKVFIKKRPAIPSTKTETMQGEALDSQDSDISAYSYAKAALIFLITCIYVASMSLKISGFLGATIVYIFLAGSIMKSTNLAGKAKMASFAIVFSLATFFIFTRFFYIDLP
jgi:putative tricarboxylic transport membrane protein